MAERIAEQVPKGSHVCIQGRLSPATWTNREGKQQTKFKVSQMAWTAVASSPCSKLTLFCLLHAADLCQRSQVCPAATTACCSTTATAKRLGTAAAAAAATGKYHTAHQHTFSYAVTLGMSPSCFWTYALA